MIGKAMVFAMVMLAPGLAFAADSAAPGGSPTVAAHEQTGSTSAVKSDGKQDANSAVAAKSGVKAAKTVKTAKAKTHKAKITPAGDKKTESNS